MVSEAAAWQGSGGLRASAAWTKEELLWEAAVEALEWRPTREDLSKAWDLRLRLFSP